MRIYRICSIVLLFSTLTFISCKKIETEAKKIITEKGKEPNKTVAVLLDLSGSTRELRNIYLNTFKEILSSISHGDVIVVAEITESSITEPEIPVKEVFPEFVPLVKMGKPTDNEFLIGEAKRKADTNLANKKDEIVKIVEEFIFTRKAIKTDIMSSLHVAEGLFKNYPHDKSILVILSDMIEDSDDYNFERENLTQKRMEEIINKEKTRNRMPELSNVKIYVVSAGALSTEKYFLIRDFWFRYFKECGANLSKENYGSALLNFNE